MNSPDWQKRTRAAVAQQPESILTFDLDALEAHGHAQVILHATSHLLIVIGSSHVENLVIESVLAGNFSIVNEPLVAIFVNGRIGDSVTMKGSLKREQKTFSSN